MAAEAEPLAHPPHYPRNGTYADLLAWHLEYWGTRPDGNANIRGRPWEKREFQKAFFGNVDSETVRISPQNWLGIGKAPSAPREDNAKRIQSIIFGDNPAFNDWRKDLDEARERSLKGQNRRTRGFPKPPAFVEPKASLPRLTTHFIGRENERDALASALLSPVGSGAVLLQGGPGIGKTELAKAIAHHKAVADRFGERRWFIRLETAPTSEAMKDAIIRAIGCDPQQGFQAALHSLRGKPSLLILDNLETPWEQSGQRRATEEALAELGSTSDIAVLASFRGQEAVGALSWHQHVVNVLPPDVAADLFVSIAGPQVTEDARLPDFIGTLGGIPLAIELVARRAYGRASLTPLWREWIKLRTDFAVHPDYDAERLTSLPYSIELSLRSSRITPAALRLFGLLGVLPAGLSNNDARALLRNDAFAAAERLSHVGIATERDDRIDLLPPIREHATRHYQPVGADEELWVAHFLDAISLLGRAVGTVGGGDAARRLRAEFRNIEAALRITLDHSQRVEAAEAFHYFVRAVRWSPIPTTLLDELVIACRQEKDTLGEANYTKVIGDLALHRSDYDAAQSAYEKAVPLYRLGENRPEREADCVRMMGNVALYRSDYAKARSTFEHAISLYRQCDDELGEANCVKGLANIALHLSDYEIAKTAFEDARVRYQRVGDDLGEANCIKGLADIALHLSDYAIAQAAFEEARILYCRIGDDLGQANCIMRQGNIALYQSEMDDARTAYKTALEIYLAIKNSLGEANCIKGFGDIALVQSDYPLARNAYLEAHALYTDIGNKLGLTECILRMGDVEMQSACYEPAKFAFREALAIFRDMNDEVGQTLCTERISVISQLEESKNQG